MGSLQAVHLIRISVSLEVSIRFDWEPLGGANFRQLIWWRGRQYEFLGDERSFERAPVYR